MSMCTGHCLVHLFLLHLSHFSKIQKDKGRTAQQESSKEEQHNRVQNSWHLFWPVIHQVLMDRGLHTSIHQVFINRALHTGCLKNCTTLEIKELYITLGHTSKVTPPPWYKGVGVGVMDPP